MERPRSGSAQCGDLRRSRSTRADERHEGRPEASSDARCRTVGGDRERRAVVASTRRRSGCVAVTVEALEQRTQASLPHRPACRAAPRDRSGPLGRGRRPVLEPDGEDVGVAHLAEERADPRELGADRLAPVGVDQALERREVRAQAPGPTRRDARARYRCRPGCLLVLDQTTVPSATRAAIATSSGEAVVIGWASLTKASTRHWRPRAVVRCVDQSAPAWRRRSRRGHGLSIRELRGSDRLEARTPAVGSSARSRAEQRPTVASTDRAAPQVVATFEEESESAPAGANWAPRARLAKSPLVSASSARGLPGVHRSRRDSTRWD